MVTSVIPLTLEDKKSAKKLQQMLKDLRSKMKKMTNKLGACYNITI